MYYVLTRTLVGGRLSKAEEGRIFDLGVSHSH